MAVATATTLLSAFPLRAQDLQWEPVAPPPPLQGGSDLSWEPVPSQPAPTASFGTPSTTATSSLVWQPVPPQQVIDPQPVLADSGSFEEGGDQLPEPASTGVPAVRGVARGITVNTQPYPDVGYLVPNGFAQDQQFIATASLNFTSRTRGCRVGGNTEDIDCADVEANFDFTPLKGENASFGFLWTVQSLTGRNDGTATLAGQSLGFRAALNLTPTTGLAIGGEHVVQFDDTTDLGRNYYLVLSQALPLSGGPEPILLVGTAGVGSNLYGYGNSDGSLGSNDCLPGYDCPWGGIGAVSLHLNNRLGFLWEYSGFAITAGLSARPFRDLPLTVSFYATDFLGNNPDYISDFCTDDPCRTRYYARMSLSW